MANASAKHVWLILRHHQWRWCWLYDATMVRDLQPLSPSCRVVRSFRLTSGSASVIVGSSFRQPNWCGNANYRLRLRYHVHGADSILVTFGGTWSKAIEGVGLRLGWHKQNSYV
jgi:hypothetical protein